MQNLCRTSQAYTVAKCGRACINCILQKASKRLPSMLPPVSPVILLQRRRLELEQRNSSGACGLDPDRWLLKVEAKYLDDCASADMFVRNVRCVFCVCEELQYREKPAIHNYALPTYAHVLPHGVHPHEYDNHLNIFIQQFVKPC